MKKGDACWALFHKVDWLIVWPRDANETLQDFKEKLQKERQTNDNDDNDDNESDALPELPVEAVEARRRVPRDASLISAVPTPLVDGMLLMSEDEYSAARLQHDTHVKEQKELEKAVQVWQALQNKVDADAKVIFQKK